MPKEYIPAPEMDDYVHQFIELMHEFTALRENNIRFRCVYTAATDKDGNPVSQDRDPIQLKKLSDMTRVLLKATYLMDIDDYDWANAEDETLRRYWLHRTLSQIDVLVNEEGKVTLKKHEPEVCVYVRTLHRYPQYEGLQFKAMDDFDSEVFKFQFQVDEDIALSRLKMPKAISHATVTHTDGEGDEADGGQREEPAASPSRRRARAAQEPEEPENPEPEPDGTAPETEQEQEEPEDTVSRPRGKFDPSPEEQETARVRVHTDAEPADQESRPQKTPELRRSNRNFVGRTQSKMREALTS